MKHTLFLFSFIASLFPIELVSEEPSKQITGPPRTVFVNSQSSKEIELNQYVRYLLDSTNTASLQDIRKIFTTQGKYANRQVNFGESSDTFWYTFTLYNQDSIAFSRFFVIEDYFLEEIDTYLISNDSIRAHLLGGCSIPFSKRKIQNRYTVHRIKLEPLETVHVFVRVRCRLTMSVPLKLWSEDAFVYADSLGQIPMWIYYGIAFGLFTYNLFIWLTLRSNAYLLYLLYTLHISAFLFWGSNGLGFQFFSLSVEISIRLIMYLGIMSMALVSILTSTFLDLRNALPKWNIILKLGSRALIVLAFGAWILPIPFVRDVGNLATGILALLCGTVAIRSIWLGYTPAKYFAAGWVSFLIVTILFVLQNEGIVEWYFIGQYGAQFASGLEMILFSIALASRISVLEKDRRQAREELLFTSQALIQNLQESEKTLELKVEERTKNLQEANEQLNVQAYQIQLVNSILQEQNLALDDSRQQIERLMLNILPKTIFMRLQAGEKRIADKFESVTVLFADIVNFTDLSAKTPPVELVGLLDTLFSRFDELAEKYNVEKIKTIGDAYMVVGGLPGTEEQHTHAIAMLALEMQKTTLEMALLLGIPQISLRIGIHSGEVVAGVIGMKKFAYDLWGDTVNTASRMESHSEPGRIHVSENIFHTLNTYNHTLLRDREYKTQSYPASLTQTPHFLSKQKFAFHERGLIDVKGKGLMRTWFLLGLSEKKHSN